MGKILIIGLVGVMILLSGCLAPTNQTGTPTPVVTPMVTETPYVISTPTMTETPMMTWTPYATGTAYATATISPVGTGPVTTYQPEANITALVTGGIPQYTESTMTATIVTPTASVMETPLE